ncbi:MAG TPA: TonB-dependent receptor [Herbaspirillum sp.]|jgi:iron complex outermembrane receptor protein|nr:TonB-dependent receptor [Herbaspirillum sp.]
MGKRSGATVGMRRVREVVLTLGAMLPLSAAIAQTIDTSPATSATSDAPEMMQSSQLGTVTVTAERKAENIQDVPISVTTLSGDALNALTATGQDVRVLATHIPSLNIESSTGRVSPRFYIRGYGNTDFSAFASQPVSVIMDDVVQENVILKGIPMFDIADVEVLRGPQGTLFGRNTPAGVVKFESVKPTLDKVSGYYNLSDGTHNASIMEGAINVPLSDQWAMRFSAQVQHKDNWVTNIGNPNQTSLDGYNERAARLQFLYQPSTSFNALISLHDRSTSGSARLFSANIIQPGTNNLVPGYSPSVIDINSNNTQNLHAAGGNVHLTWNLDNDLSLHSITGLETVSSFFSQGDIDGGTPTGPGFIPFQVATAGSVPHLNQFSQEFRVESKYKGPLNWQTGLYYFNENVLADNIGYDAYSSAEPQTSLLRNRQKNQAEALFGSLSYDVSSRMKLRGGVRYTRDTKDFSTEIDQNVAFTGPGSISETAHNISWDTSADYKLTNDVNAYARVATGYRAPSIAAPSANVPITVAKAETVTSYEAGIKADLFDHRARANFSVYAYDVKNQQLTAVGGASNSITLVNAAKTVGRGAELDFQARVTPNLLMTLGGSYNFTKIEDPNLFVAGCASCTMLNTQNSAGFFSINGNPLPQAPKWNIDASARYTIPTANGEYFLSTDWAYRSQINLFLYNSTEFTGKALLDGGARVGYDWDGGKYEVAAFVSNMLNKVVVTGAIDFDNLTGFTNDLRMFGVQFRATF